MTDSGGSTARPARALVQALMMVAYSSLFSSLVVERIGQRIGLGCMCALLFAAFTCIVYERIYDDIRLCLMFQLILPLAIAAVAYMYPSNYTHSTYWFSSIGIYLLAKLEAVSDKKLYRANNYVISGHSLEHVCLALIPFLLSVMLICRERKFKRYLMMVILDGLFSFM
ncbi:alkaline phytoceramidase [Trifolium pratense]|uniref:Alkaline phytoceramidase n=1 Tax=Trifolium pratense TaxID=57577 RepID=A0A2K3L5G7_TRIPR|nr:alkaline phytoceramidase [Trifolium pratense]